MIVCTLVIQWCWTSVSPRQDREKEPESKSRSQTVRSPVFFGIYFRRYYSRLLSFFSLGEEGYTLHSLRRGGATKARRLVVRLLWPDVHHQRAVGFGPSQDQACHRSSVENVCRGVARCGCVGECRLWPRNVSEAGVALARGPRDLRRKNRKLWRPTDAKIICEQSAVPSSSDIHIFQSKTRPRRKFSMSSTVQ